MFRNSKKHDVKLSFCLRFPYGTRCIPQAYEAIPDYAVHDRSYKAGRDYAVRLKFAGIPLALKDYTRGKVDNALSHVERPV